MEEQVQQLYDSLLKNTDLLVGVVNSPHPKLVLGKHIRVDKEINQGELGLLESMKFAEDFLRLYNDRLQQYKRTAEQ